MNMAAMTELPPVDISVETRDAVVVGVRQVMAQLQKAELLDKEVTYQKLLVEPETLFYYIQTYRGNRAACDAIVKSADGKPVRDDKTILSCGVNLLQVQRLMVLTCAKRVFGVSGQIRAQPAEEKPAKSGFGFFKKAEKEEPKLLSNKERFLSELAKYLAFDWQLPLLDIYRQHLTYQHLLELGSDLAVIPTEQAIEAAGKLDPADIRKAREVLENEFVTMLNDNPQAVNGVIYWNRDWYKFLRPLLGRKVWQFFARDRQFFSLVANMDKSKIRIFGESLAFIAPENLAEFERLNIDKIAALVGAFHANFGLEMEGFMSEKRFAKDILRRLVESFMYLKKDQEQIKIYADLTCKAIGPSIDAWRAKLI